MGRFPETFLSACIDVFYRFRVYKKAGYSVQGVYVVVNNLPLPLRNLHENMMLACVMPGPKEPSDFEFNQILEPLVDEFIVFGRGE
jgi:anthranilate/para-aminobenzoate synthase component II